MWCNNCQQDVPAVGRSGSTKLECSRCHTAQRAPHVVGISQAGIALDDAVALEVVDSRPPLAADDWQLRRRTRELGRKLRYDTTGAGRRAQAAATPNTFSDLAERTATPIVEPASHAKQQSNTAAPSPESGQYFAWFVTFIGTAAFAGGVGLITWSIANNRPEYWEHALALTLGGQGTLILGLVLIVARLWRNSRYASGKLQQVHVELGQLQRTAEALTAMRTSSAPAFYADLVRGASPQMLLTNLKGQLDQLSTRLGEQY
jgi:hypothetical protein